MPLPVMPINLPTFAQSNPGLESSQFMDQLRAMQLANQHQAIANQYLGPQDQANIGLTKAQGNYTNQEANQYANLIASKLAAAKAATMDPHQKLLNAYASSVPGTAAHAYYAALLNNSAAPKQGTSVTMPDGSSVSMGGSGTSPNIFNSGLPTNPNQASTTMSNAQKGARGNAGAVYTTRDKNGNVISQTSAQTNKNLSSNQAAAEAIQTLLPQLNQLDKLGPAAQFNYWGHGPSHFLHGLSNMIWPRQTSDVEQFNDATSRLAGIQDTLISAINVPKTTPGLDVLHKFIYPGEYETQSQYENRLKNTVIPELNSRYQIITNALKNGINLTPNQKVEILNGQSVPGLTGANNVLQRNLSVSPQQNITKSPFKDPDATIENIRGYAKHLGISVPQAIDRLRKSGVK